MATTGGSQNENQGTVTQDRGGAPVTVDPDLDFIQAITDQAGGSFKKCFQCGTCSATCELSPEEAPFPRKEMAWAAWGRKKRLLADVDVWLCHQCNDCSSNCPRGGRPGDVLAAVRNECVQHYSAPRFLARWVSRPRYLPFLLSIPAILLTVALLLRKPLGDALGFSTEVGDRIVFPYSRTLPHWLINLFFLSFTVLALIVIFVGVVRFWRALAAAHKEHGGGPPVKGVFASFLTTVKSVFTHDKFKKCSTAKTRSIAHMAVFYGFLGLFLVTLWVITCRINPILPDKGFIYPFDFWSPWKMLANLGGLAVLFGLVLMIRDRVRPGEPGGGTRFPDWGLIAAIFLVVSSGFATEVLHYLRLEPHRHAVYFVHLVFVFGLLMYLPYSKLAHVIYRTTAMVFAEHTGRKTGRDEASEKGGTR